MQTSNLDTLTEKIYREGITKAEEEAALIIEQADKEATEILEKASAKATELISKAKKDAEQLSRKSEGEIKLKSQQLLSDLKRAIKSLVKDHIINKNVKELVTSTDFLKDVILQLVADWKKGEEIEIIFSNDLKSKLDSQFEGAIAETIKDLSISFGPSKSTGFTIKRSSDNYQISFTDEDFQELFGSYLDERTSTLLFS